MCFVERTKRAFEYQRTVSNQHIFVEKGTFSYLEEMEIFPFSLNGNLSIIYQDVILLSQDVCFRLFGYHPWPYATKTNKSLLLEYWKPVCIWINHFDLIMQMIIFSLIFLAFRNSPLALATKPNILLLLGYWDLVCIWHNHFDLTMQMIIFNLMYHAFYPATRKVHTQPNIIFLLLELMIDGNP